MAIIEDEIPTLGEVAVYMKAGKRTDYCLASNGQTPAFELRGAWVFRKVYLELWIEEQTLFPAIQVQSAGSKGLG